MIKLRSILFVSCLIVFAIFFLIRCKSVIEDVQAVPFLLYADGTVIHALKTDYEKGETSALAFVTKLNECADSALDAGPFSVMKKDIIPPSGDKHDYISQGPYWWPDSTKPNGLPYIRRDGIVNPERSKFTDRQNLHDLIESVDNLSKAYYFTETEAYADKVISLLKVWFLDDSTKMNPHLEFGQGIPGITDGRGIGIIETRTIGKIADAIELIRSSKNWSQSIEMDLKTWFGDYLNWLLYSEKGQKEALHPNNHGTWYDVQTISLAISTNQDSLARAIAERAKTMRIDPHIMADGSQPKELARTVSYSYSAMNLQGLFYLAYIADKIGVDLWSYRNVNGATLQNALDFLIPTALGDEKWPYEQIKPIPKGNLKFHLLLASKVYDEKYADILKRITMPENESSCTHIEFLF